MEHPDRQRKELYADKPECVTGLPEWMLSRKTREVLRLARSPALVEIAGRDSIAAAILAARERGLSDLLPVYAYTGTEYGPFQKVLLAVQNLRQQLPGVTIHDLILMGSPRLWQALNGRFVSELIARFGFYTPCVGCHLYLHSIRIPLALELGGLPIVSGERESHDGDVKVNQSASVIDRYQSFARAQGVSLLLPLRQVEQGEKVEEILGFLWDEGKEQLGCVLSGNYRGVNKEPMVTEARVLHYLEEFAIPVVQQTLNDFLQGRPPDPLGIAADCLRPLKTNA